MRTASARAERIYLIADAICRTLERAWAHDRDGRETRTLRVLDALSRAYLSRDLARAELS